MEIPYEVTARPDTGLYNAKLGIWLFLASEVMLFGGLFSAYVFLRLGADPGYWPHGLLNVPVGMGNTFILILSSVTVVLAWASLKMRKWNLYWWFMLATILCGAAFLGVKLGYEWPQKFKHFGVFIKPDALAKYEGNLGNQRRQQIGREIRREITGHLEGATMVINGEPKVWTEVHSAGELNRLIDDEVNNARQDRLAQLKKAKVAELKHDLNLEESRQVEEQVNSWAPEVKTKEIELKLDKVNEAPDDPENDRPHFLPPEEPTVLKKIDGDDIESMSAFVPRHSSYFSTYFLITGLHGLHVLGGVIVFVYFLLFGKKLYLRNPEHMANRVEVAGLFWHFVDLVWIFVFPIFYLL